MPFRNARKHTIKCEQQGEREREIHRATTQATTKEQKQKTNDDQRPTTLAAPPSIAAAPVFFDQGTQSKVVNKSKRRRERWGWKEGKRESIQHELIIRNKYRPSNNTRKATKHNQPSNQQLV